MKTYDVKLTEQQLTDLKRYVLSQEINANSPKIAEHYSNLFARLCAAVHVSTEYDATETA